MLAQDNLLAHAYDINMLPDRVKVPKDWHDQ